GEIAADSLHVLADRADLRAVQVAALDLRDLALTDADADGELTLGQAETLAQLAQAIRTHLAQHPLPVRVDTRAVRGALLEHLLASESHRDHCPSRLLSLSRCFWNSASAFGMFRRYHCFQLPALSPAISMIA